MLHIFNAIEVIDRAFDDSQMRFINGRHEHRGQWLTMNNQGFVVNVKRLFIEFEDGKDGKILWLTIYRAPPPYVN